MVVPPDADLQLLIKTHKLTIFIQSPQKSTLSELKEKVLSALQQFAKEGANEGIPMVDSADDFEICQRKSGANQPKYTILETGGAAADTTIKKAQLKGWEPLFLRFRNEDGDLAEVE
ncbi:hypothetical protein FRC02_001412, partial [Tulasnella sp. 418]